MSLVTIVTHVNVSLQVEILRSHHLMCIVNKKKIEIMNILQELPKLHTAQVQTTTYVLSLCFRCMFDFHVFTLNVTIHINSSQKPLWCLVSKPEPKLMLKLLFHITYFGDLIPCLDYVVGNYPKLWLCLQAMGICRDCMIISH